MENPSSGQSGGVLGHIAGARSRDPDESPDKTAQQPEGAEAIEADASPTVSEGSGEQKTETEKVHARQLRERISQLEGQLGNLDGFAQLGMAVANTPEGQEVVARWQKGEELFAKVQKGTPAARTGLTREELAAELDRREAARRNMDDLNELAEDKFPEFKKISKNPKYTQKLNATLVAVWDQSPNAMPVADEAVGWADQSKARNYTAMKEAYEWFLKGNPKVVEAAKEAGRKEADERNQAALAGELSSPGTSTSKGESKKKTDEDEMIERMMGARGIGRSFGTVGRGGEV
jgi:hypothetical protein